MNGATPATPAMPATRTAAATPLGQGATLRLAVLGIGCLGPGFANWPQLQQLLKPPAAGDEAQTALPRTVVAAPARLPPNERRRAGEVVKAALAVADEATRQAQLDELALGRMATVFTSATGDPANCHALCEALAQPQRVVSPTRFTNSVHNAPAGYWHIAVQGRAASTSIAAFDASFGAGLLEAASQCVASGQAVLLVASDVPYPEPLNALRAIANTVAVALVLLPSDHAQAQQALAHLCLEVASAQAVITPCAQGQLEAIRQGTPAAQALPLLHALMWKPSRDSPTGVAELAVVLSAASDSSFALAVRLEP